MEYEIKPREKLSLGLAELWQYKELFYFFTWRDIKVKYKQTVLGFAWAILQPLFMMIVFTLFFGNTLNVPTGNLPYPVFVLSGLLVWGIFSSGLSSAANSMVTNANIIKKIYFPRLIVPLSSILVALFDFFMAFLIYVLILLFYGFTTEIFMVIVWLPLVLLITIASTFGLGCLLAGLNIKYRDFRYILPFMIQALLFVTPVIYPISMLKNKTLQILMSLNPLSGPIELFRTALNGDLINWNIVVVSCISSLTLFIIGLFYFRKTEIYFADLA